MSGGARPRAAPPESELRLKAIVRITAGPTAGRCYVLRPGQRFVVGRAKDVTIRVDDRHISRRHVILSLSAEGISVTDSGSSNGTLLGGARLNPGETRLAKIGERLTLGPVELKFELDPVGDAELEEGYRAFVPELERCGLSVLGELGRGSNGIVFACLQTALNRNVAVKVPRPEVDSAENRARFMREAQLTCRLSSPYVVQLHTFHVIDDQVCLVLELVNGISASDWVRGGPLPLGEALRIGEHIASALEAAHSVGVVHRDVKPSNILLSAEGRAKLADFGIARDMNADEKGAHFVTPSGVGLGTLAYVSPEQLHDARQVTGRSDLYSLGATMFHLLTGELLFLPRCLDEVNAYLEGPVPSVRPLRRDCPPSVDALIRSLLARDPLDRPSTAAEVAAACHSFRVLFDDQTRRFTALGETDEFSGVEASGG